MASPVLTFGYEACAIIIASGIEIPPTLSGTPWSRHIFLYARPVRPLNGTLWEKPRVAMEIPK